MSTIADIVVGLIALVHVSILVLEMFLWDKPAGLRAFGQTREAATASKVLAANQGLYNGFLAAGLIWGLSLGATGTAVKVFFLCCVLVAGVYGRQQPVEKSSLCRPFQPPSVWCSCCCRERMAEKCPLTLV